MFLKSFSSFWRVPVLKAIMFLKEREVLHFLVYWRNILGLFQLLAFSTTSPNDIPIDCILHAEFMFWGTACLWIFSLAYNYWKLILLQHSLCERMIKQE